VVTQEQFEQNILNFYHTAEQHTTCVIGTMALSSLIAQGKHFIKSVNQQAKPNAQIKPDRLLVVGFSMLIAMANNPYNGYDLHSEVHARSHLLETIGEIAKAFTDDPAAQEAIDNLWNPMVNFHSSPFPITNDEGGFGPSNPPISRHLHD
jgi:hypothetical protein